MKIKNLVFLTFILLLVINPVFNANSQNVALKTNLVYDALLNVNAGIEIGLAPRWTLDLNADYNGWTLSHNRKWKHWMVQPSARYWFCDRFSGHFVGVHAHGGEYNVGGLKNDIDIFGTNFSILSNSRFQGWFVGGGVSYGYAWALNKHWNIEAEIGLGYAYTRFDRYQCAGCGKKVESDKSHHYVGPTKAAINLVYLF